MSKIVIKKRVSLDFLGEEYKEAYLTFRTIPLPDYKEFIKNLPESDEEYNALVIKIDSGQAEDKDVERFNELKKQRGDKDEKSLDFILDVLKKYFITGEFPNDDGKLDKVTKEDLEGIDANTAIQVFSVLRGGLDPKV